MEIIKKYSAEWIQLAATVLLLVDFFLLCLLTDNSWLRFGAAFLVPMVSLLVFSNSDLKEASQRDLLLYVWVGCQMVILAGLLCISYSSEWLTAVIVVETILTTLCGLVALGVKVLSDCDLSQ